VTWIGEAHIREFYRCNVWRVRRRDGDMLVDSGMGVVSLGKRLALVPERPLHAVASHTHFDHIGFHHEFPCHLCHEAEAELMAHPTRANTLACPYVVDDNFTTLPQTLYISTSYAVKSAPATRILQDRDVVDLGDRHFEVIHTPGHSPGGIALWEAATGVLFSGDIVYDGPLIEDTYHSNASDYHRSMVRLYDLPVRVAHGGHFASYGCERHRQITGDWLAGKARG